MQQRTIFLVVATAVVAILSTVNGLDGFAKKQNLLHREPLITPKGDARAVELEYIEQWVDNFDPTNQDTFQMRYYRNDDFFQTDGPIFIYIGGEWTINPGSLRGGHMYDMAIEFGAQMFYTEHRYYGSSHPTENATTENLRFLTIEQALADLAHFIVRTKQEPKFHNSKVVLVGGSYAATMVAWFRQLYPHLAVGGWASSAPMLAKLDFVEYKEVVGAAMRYVGGESCYRRLENAFAQAEELVANGETEEFRSLFRLCDDFDPEIDVGPAFSTFTDVLAGVVQYHSTGDIEYICDRIMEDPNDNDLQAFARFMRWYLYGNDEDDCLWNYNDTIEYYRNTSWASGATRSAARQWFYQTCTEYGWYQTSGSEFQPFGSSFPVELSYQWCSDLYGDQINSETMHINIDRKNVLYGGFSPVINNVYFTHGLIDPWRTMGIQWDLNNSSPTDIIPDASHCADLNSNRPGDSMEMRQVRQRIIYLIRLWLGNLPVPYENEV